MAAGAGRGAALSLIVSCLKHSVWVVVAVVVVVGDEEMRDESALSSRCGADLFTLSADDFHAQHRLGHSLHTDD